MIDKKSVARIGAATVAALALGAMTIGPSVKAQAPLPPGVNPGGPMQGERHPEIRHAIRALARARQHLQEASHDFGGHRVDAIAAIDEAEKQLKICLRYDHP